MRVHRGLKVGVFAPRSIPDIAMIFGKPYDQQSRRVSTVIANGLQLNIAIGVQVLYRRCGHRAVR